MFVLKIWSAVLFQGVLQNNIGTNYLHKMYVILMSIDIDILYTKFISIFMRAPMIRADHGVVFSYNLYLFVKMIFG